MSECKSSVLFNPRNPLCVPNLSGRLIHHKQPCDTCNGTGFYPEEMARFKKGELDELGEEAQCEDCDGEGFFQWPCWYSEDRGYCRYCSEGGVLLALMYEGTFTSTNDAQWVCLPCYLKHHKESCGCDKWEWAEKRILGLL